MTKSKTNAKRSWPDFTLWGQRLIEASQEDATSKPLSLDPALYIVATPIGHLGDVTLRALWTLSQVDAVLCEDTRVSGGLLHHYGIKKPLLSCHDHNEEARIRDVLSRLKQGQSLALVSDAGTPLISDPGFRLVRACRQAGYKVFALPGANAALTALASAGLATDRFLFIGFLPSKSTARKKVLASLANTQATMVFYESAQRLSGTLADMRDAFSDTRAACVARELTKMHEEVRAAPLADLSAHYGGANAPKGEVVILVEGGEAEIVTDTDVDALLLSSLRTRSVRDSATHVAAQTGCKKGDVYARALSLSKALDQ